MSSSTFPTNHSVLPMTSKMRGPDSAKLRRRQSHDSRLHKKIWEFIYGLHLLQESLIDQPGKLLCSLDSRIAEISQFISRTDRDISFAIKDIAGRARYLKTPQSAAGVFERMLEHSLEFCEEVLGDAEGVGKVIFNTQTALDRCLEMSEEGLVAIEELADSMIKMEKAGWKNATVARFQDTLAQSAESWCNGFIDMQTKGKVLQTELNGLKVVTMELVHRTEKAARRHTNQKNGQAMHHHNKHLPVTPPQSPGHNYHSHHTFRPSKKASHSHLRISSPSPDYRSSPKYGTESAPAELPSDDDYRGHQRSQSCPANRLPDLPSPLEFEIAELPSDNEIPAQRIRKTKNRRSMPAPLPIELESPPSSPDHYRGRRPTKEGVSTPPRGRARIDRKELPPSLKINIPWSSKYQPVSPADERSPKKPVNPGAYRRVSFQPDTAELKFDLIEE